jgi:hypothetical protein
LTQGQKVTIAVEKLIESPGPLRVIVHVSSGAFVGIVREAHEGGGGVSTGNGSGVHFAENHSCRFNEADGGVDGEEFAGRAGAEGVSVIHAETIRYPIIFVSREIGEFIGAVGSGWEGFLQLVIWSPVIATYPKATFLDIYVLGGVGWGFANDVGSRGRRRFRFGVESARQHLGGPSRENGGGTGAPFRYRDTHVFPICLKIQVDGWMLSKGRK